MLVKGCVPQPRYHSDGEGRRVRAEPTQTKKKKKAPASRPRTHPAPKTPGKRGPAPTVEPPAKAHPLDPAAISTAKAYQVGVASYYGKKFHGRKTASGETFNMYKLSAAHRILPLGTVIKVTNLENGRWVVVTVNDRGPFVEGRILDLSFAAALELEMVGAGTARVMIEIVEKVE